MCLAGVGYVLHSYCIVGKPYNPTGYLDVPPSDPCKKTSKFVNGWWAMCGKLGSRVRKRDIFHSGQSKPIPNKLDDPLFYLLACLVFNFNFSTCWQKQN